MEAVELRQLSNTIAGSIGRPLGEFRQAAADSHKNLSKVVKDISSMFAAQKKDTAGISEAIQESIDVGNQHAQKADQTNNLIQESISIQSSMAAEIKNMVVGIRNLTSSISFMSSSTNNQSIFGKIFDVLGSAALLGGGVLAGLGAANMFSGGADVPGIKTSGNLAQNQQEAYAAAKAEGLSDSAAKIAVANVSGENLKNPGGVYADPSSRNPNQKAHGIVAWDDERSARIKQNFGKYPQEMSVAEQTKAYIWEMKTHYNKAYQDLVNENLSEQQRLASVVENFEKPKDVSGAVRNRMGFLKGLNVKDVSPVSPAAAADKGKEHTHDATPTTKSTAGGGTLGFGLQGGMSSDQKTNIGAAAPAGKLASLTPTGGAGSYPSGDIIGLGKALQGEGLRVSEHPSFGGVLGKHHGRGHYEGRAIDINMGYGVTESKSAALGARFDALADKLTSLGYKVFWRGKGQGKYGLTGHENHLHAEVPAGGAQVAGAQPTGAATDTETPQAAVAQETATEKPQLSAFGQQIQQAMDFITSGTENQLPIGMSSLGAGSMMGGLGGLMGGMDVGSMISSLMPSLSAVAPNITPSIAQMIPDTSNTTRNVAMVNQAQIQSQAEDHNARMALVENSQNNQKQDNQIISSMAQDGAPNSWDYNNASDLKWPEWADLGRTGWSEVNKIRTIA